VHEIDPEIHFKCGLHVTVTQCAACAMLTHISSRIRTIRVHAVSVMSVPLSNNIQVRKLCYQRKNTMKENRGNLVLTYYRIVSVHLIETFCPPKSLNMKFGRRRDEEKYCTVLKIMSITSGCIYPIKTVGEQPMYQNCASLCSLCKGKDGAKTIYISLLS